MVLLGRQGLQGQQQGGGYGVVGCELDGRIGGTEVGLAVLWVCYMVIWLGVG